MVQSTQILSVQPKSNFVISTKTDLSGKSSHVSHWNYDWAPPPEEENLSATFCLETSLHGLHNIGHKDRHFSERIFWGVAFIGAAVAAWILISEIWLEYKETPIVTLFDAKELSIGHIPFPSVTVCNTNNVAKEAFDLYMGKITEALDNKSNMNFSKDPETLKLFATMADMFQICATTATTFVDRFVNSTFKDKIKPIEDVLERHRSNFLKYRDPIATLQKVTQTCDELILKCVWEGNVVVNCSSIFHNVITDYGYCCTFNSIPTSLLKTGNMSHFGNEDPETVKAWRDADLNTENLILSHDSPKTKMPYRQKYAGRSAGLSFLLNSGPEQYFCQNTNSKGFILGLQLPIDSPKLKEIGIAVPTSSEVFIGIRPEITVSENAISQFSLNDRQCYYGNEHSLDLFTKYTTVNCLRDCTTRKTMEECKCVRYSSPHNNKSNICKEKYGCPSRVRRQIMIDGQHESCKECLSPCTDIEYHQEVTALRIHRERIADLFTKDAEIKYKNRTDQMSIVHTYFNTDSVHPRIRKRLTSIEKIISNAGGILGLCMGFSMLSLLEILYYCTMRMYFGVYAEKTAMKQIIRRVQLWIGKISEKASRRIVNETSPFHQEFLK